METSLCLFCLASWVLLDLGISIFDLLCKILHILKIFLSSCSLLSPSETLMSGIVQFFTFPCLVYISQNILFLDYILDIFRVTFLFLSSSMFILLLIQPQRLFNYTFFICFSFFGSLCGCYLLSLILFLYFQDFFFYVIKHFKYYYLLCLIF